MNFSEAFTTIEKLTLLQRWLIVHSVLYYRFNTSMVTDFVFNDNCMQYVELSQSTTDEGKYQYAFQGFDGSTGFDLETNLTEEDHEYIMCIVNYIMRQFKL